MTSSEQQTNFEARLREAFAPVEPPSGVMYRISYRLAAIRDHAQEDLAGWELSSMRNPRNWVKPAVAVTVGGAATAGLVLLGARKVLPRVAARG